MSSFKSRLSQTINRIFYPDRSIKLVGRVDLESSTNLIDAFAPLMTSKWDNKKGGKVLVDLTEAEFIYPSALLFIFAIAETLKGVATIDLQVEAGSAVHEYLHRNGFGECFSLEQFPSSEPVHFQPGEVLRLEMGDTISNPQKKAEWFVDRLHEVRPMPFDFETDTLDSVEEIFMNVLQHSKFQKWYGMGQCYPHSKRVRLAFYDNGQGIKTHITRRKYTDHHARFREIINSNDYRKMRQLPANFAIQKAAIDSVSGGNYKVNAGAGIAHAIQKMSVKADGTVAIQSEDGLVVWKRGEITLDVPLPYSVKGTIVSLSAAGLE